MPNATRLRTRFQEGLYALIPYWNLKGNAILVLEGKTRFIRQGKNKLVIYVPADIVKDSRFQFKGDEELFITVEPEYQSIFVTLAENLPSYKRSSGEKKE